MDTVYFISDIHLGTQSLEVEQQKTAQLTQFLNAISKNADYLYIVGDLFDFWFEYRHAIPKLNLTILFKFHEMMEAGVQISYLAGNHDGWLGNYLEDELGIQIIRNPLDAQHNSLNLYVAHGDGLLDQDRKQRLLNRILRNRTNIFLYKLIHPDLGIPLAKYVSRKSHEGNSRSFEAEYREFALKKLEDGYDGVILGHTHKPVFEKIGEKFYANLGDWLDNFTYLELYNSQICLKTWGEREE